MGLTVAELEQNLNLIDAEQNSLVAEVTAARGSTASLDARLDIAHNPDGTLRSSVATVSFVTETAAILSYPPTGDCVALAGDLTAVYKQYMRLRINETLYPYVVSSVYNVGGDYTVVTFSAPVGSSITKVEYSFDPVALPRGHIVGSDDILQVANDTDTAGIKHISNSQYKSLIDSITARVLTATLAAVTNGAGIDLVGLGIKRVHGIDALRLTNGDITPFIFLTYHTSYEYGGGGAFYWDPTSELADDNGAVVQVTGVAVGRWIRIIECNYVLPEWWGARGNGVYVDDDAFDAALAYIAGNSGLFTIFCGNKRYLLQHLRVGLLNQRVTIKGTATRVESKSGALSADVGTVFLIHAASTDVGVTLEAAASGLEGIVILGQDGNTAKGVQLLGNSTFLKDVSVFNMGGDAIVINNPTLYSGYKVNTNAWLLFNVNARENLANGIVIDSYHLGTGGEIIGPDANGGNAYHVNTQLNGGYGIVIGHCSANNFYGLKAEGNAGYGIYLAGKGYSQLPYVAAGSFSGGNTFHNVHSEGNAGGAVGSQFYCGQYAVSNLIYGSTQYAVYDDGKNIVKTVYGSSSVKNAYYGLDNFIVNSVDAGKPTDTIPYSPNSPNFILKGLTPGITIKETDGGTDMKTWTLRASANTLSMRLVNDAGVAGDYVFEIIRVGNTVTKFTIPDGKLLVTDGIGAGNIVAGNVTTSDAKATKNMPIYDAAGTLAGYVAIYTGA